MTDGNLKKGTSPRAVTQIIINAETSSLKRIAWAYGCSKKDSDEERQLHALLVEKVRSEAG